MNRRLGRPHTVAVVMATSLAVAAACSAESVRSTPGAGHSSGGPATRVGNSGGPPAPAVLPTQPAVPVAAPAVVAKPQLTITDGTSTVTTDGRATVFGSTVTDGTWSPDGSRLAYVDGSGNIATARADGAGVVVLTKTDPRVKRAEPTWNGGGQIVFSERGADGVWRIRSVDAGGPPTAGIPDRAIYTDPFFPDPRQESDWVSADNVADLAGNTAPRVANRPASATEASQLTAVYQHAGARGPEVWVIDFNQREPVATMLGRGSAPTISPDAKRVAYLGAGGQLYVRSADPAAKTRPTQVTFGIDGIHDPTFSADGSRVIFATATDIESVSVKLAPGVNANPARVEAARAGVPSVRPAVPGAVLRLPGVDPVADAIALSRRIWNPYNVPTALFGEGRGDFVYPSEVTLVGTNDRNALFAVPYVDEGPVLFTAPGSLDPRDLAEIKRVFGASGRPENMTVFIVGDTKAVSQAAEDALKAQHYQVVRVGDSDPATQVFNQRDYTAPSIVYSTTDMAAVAQISRLRSMYRTIPVTGRTLTTPLVDLLHASGAGPLITIGPDAAAAIANAHLTSVAARTYPDPLAESLALATDPNSHPSVVAIVDPSDWRGLLLASQTALVLVVPAGKSLSPAARDWLSAQAPAISNLVVCGGADALPDGLVADANTLVSGPAGATANGLFVW